MRGIHVLAVALVLAVLGAVPALGHDERPAVFPPGTGHVPTYRTTGPSIVVCKGDTAERIQGYPDELRRRNLALLDRCELHSIQAAVDHVAHGGTRIIVLPGHYLEKKTLAPQTGDCAALDPGVHISYEQQLACPHLQNLIAVLGDGPDDDLACDGPLCDLQIEGTGRDPTDVLVDPRLRKLNGLRADRADGLYIRNIGFQLAEFNSLYVMETDGFTLDRVVTRWNDEYGILTFASDHGLYKRCEAYGNGDGGLYPGGEPDHHGARPSIEISHCDSHHNLMGYSGTAGNSTYVHDTKFHHNSTGLVTDSFVGGHPGMPQDSSRFVNNEFSSNNSYYYQYVKDELCDQQRTIEQYKKGVVCPTFPVPVGTGILIAGGNANIISGNDIHDNWRNGTMLFGVPATFRGEEDPEKEFDTSHFNRYLSNVMGIGPDGQADPNGTDFWWDGQGTGNCWSDNAPAEGRFITSNQPHLPSCEVAPTVGLQVSPIQATLVACAAANPRDESTWAGCDWFDRPPEPS